MTDGNYRSNKRTQVLRLLLVCNQATGMHMHACTGNDSNGILKQCHSQIGTIHTCTTLHVYITLLYIHYTYTVDCTYMCTLCNTIHTCTLYTSLLYIHYTYTIHITTVHTLYIHYAHTIHTLYIHYTHTIHTLYIHYTYTIHTLYTHYTHTIHNCDVWLTRIVLEIFRIH